MKNYMRDKDWTVEMIASLRTLLEHGVTYREISEMTGKSISALQHAKSRHLKNMPRQNQGVCRRERCHNFKGGVYKDCMGYLVDSSTGRRVHRILMEKHLGRALLEDELIHHLNGNPSDNRIENMVLTTRSEHKGLYHPNIGSEHRFRHG